jgi:hypothetical protein
LIACPICSGTWIAAVLVYALQIFPSATRIFLAIISSTGIAELLNALAEALSWTGQAARKRAGKKMTARVHIMRAPAKRMQRSNRNHGEDRNHYLKTLFSWRKMAVQ